VKEMRRTLATGRKAVQLLTQRRQGAKTQKNQDRVISIQAPFGSLRLCVFALKPQPRAAFSLIELMVVVVLIGIMTAMILPAMKGTFEDALLRSTARKLVDALTLANSRAVSTSQFHRVRLDRNAHRYFVERKVHDAQQGSGFVAVRDLPGADGEIDSRIAIEFRRSDESSAGDTDAAQGANWESHPDAIAFYQDGTSENAEIILTDREHFRLALRVNPTTARVRLVEMERQ
jgi:type II secretion system protein H